jgi:hypothetical protein
MAARAPPVHTRARRTRRRRKEKQDESEGQEVQEGRMENMATHGDIETRMESPRDREKEWLG